MPSIKRTGVKSVEKKTGFESYDGPEPHKRGMYRSKITQANFKQFKSGSQGYVLLLEFEAEKGDPKDHSQFDGYGIWVNLVLGDKEAMLTRESNFYAAIGVKDEPNIVFEDGDLEQGVKIKNIGGKNPIGLFVNGDLKMGTYNGEARPEIDGVYKIRESAKAASKAVVVEDEEEEELEEDEDLLEESEDAEEQTPEEREAELKASGIADLRKLAKGDYDIDTTGLNKAALVGAILDYEFGGEEEEEPEDEEEEELEEEELEEEELEEEEDDERAEREAELAASDRNALKRIIRTVLPDFKVYTKTTDDEIREAILAEEFGDGEETPF